MNSLIAVLLLAHGTPDRVEEIPEYLRNVTSGRPVSEMVIQEVTHRYSLIGRSPLTALTMRQAELLQEKIGVPVFVGMRNWHPYIPDTVRKMRESGINQIVAICMAPQNSRTSVGLYKKPVLEAASAQLGRRLPVVFTAHSVPSRTIEAGDPYDKQVRETATLVAQQLG